MALSSFSSLATAVLAQARLMAAANDRAAGMKRTDGEPPVEFREETNDPKMIHALHTELSMSRRKRSARVASEELSPVPAERFRLVMRKPRRVNPRWLQNAGLSPALHQSDPVAR